MYNHRNGKWFNTALTIIPGESHEMRARRRIEAGEQIYNSYNMCDECGGRIDSGYGTAGKWDVLLEAKALFRFLKFRVILPSRAST